MFVAGTAGAVVVLLCGGFRSPREWEHCYWRSGGCMLCVRTSSSCAVAAWCCVLCPGLLGTCLSLSTLSMCADLVYVTMCAVAACCVLLRPAPCVKPCAQACLWCCSTGCYSMSLICLWGRLVSAQLKAATSSMLQLIIRPGCNVYGVLSV